MANGKYEKKSPIANINSASRLERKPNSEYVGKYERRSQTPTKASSNKQVQRPKQTNVPPIPRQAQRPKSPNTAPTPRQPQRPKSTNTASARRQTQRPQNMAHTKNYSQHSPPHRRKIRGKKKSLIYKILKMNSKTKRKIFSLLAASYLSINSVPLQTSPGEITQIIPESEKPPIIYTIAKPIDGAEIVVDDQTYQIDKNSFIIVSEDESLAYDVHGNFFKGYIDSKHYKEVKTLTEEEMAKFNVYQVTSDIDVNVRSYGAIENDNRISTVPSYDYVLGYDPVTPGNDKEWILTLSINNDYLYEGYIREDLVKKVDKFEALNYRVEEQMEYVQDMMSIDTSKDDYVSLNMRTEPESGTQSNIIIKIPYGSLVRILGQRTILNGRNWITISYEAPNGIEYQGWVVEDYLTQGIVAEKPRPEDGKDIASENMTGIDISTISPKDLRELLQNGIPDEVKSNFGNFDTSQLAGKINYVYIKLGASPYTNCEFEPLEYSDYIEQVKICEEFGIPYGFYYYSTAITVEEAEIELECIKQRVEDLRNDYDLKSNLLEIAIDIELNDRHDRQYNGDIKEQTEAKAVLINGIQEQGLSDNVLIYCPSRVMRPDLDQIFDLEQLRPLLVNPDNVALWQCSLMKSNGKIQSTLEEDIAYAKEKGFSTVMCQLVLDGTVVGRVDINSMNPQHFQKLINQEKSYNTITNEDNER